GPALGPTIGGIILHITTWHWIFMINVPFGIIGVIIACLLIPTPPKMQTPVPFNWLGFVLFSVGLSLVTLSMAVLGDNFEWLKLSMILGAGAVILLAVYVHLSLKQTNPMLDLNLFKQKTFRIAMIVNFLPRIGIGATPFLMALLLQVLWGRSALFSGSIFIFLALGMMSTRIFVNQTLLWRYGYRNVMLVVSSLLSIISMNLCWFSTPKPYWLLGLIMFVIGVLTSQLYMSVGTLYPSGLERSQFSQGTSIASTIQQFSMGFGVACAAISLHLIAKLSHLPLFSSTIFFWTFIGLNLIGATSIFFIVQLDRDAGRKAKT
ncbi:MAG: MFS transporter, partial [Gammaproteobacteria bacterium]|nr:MFS transporter [Gammaproteobacteria bacterium]